MYYFLLTLRSFSAGGNIAMSTNQVGPFGSSIARDRAMQETMSSYERGQFQVDVVPIDGSPADVYLYNAEQIKC